MNNGIIAPFEGQPDLTFKLNVTPSRPDPRNWKFSVAAPMTVPDLIDLRPSCPPVFDQGSLGSCTGNAQAALYQIIARLQKYMDFPVSRLFVYYFSRYLEGSIAYDSGASIADSVKTLAQFGAPHETLWPYILGRYTSAPSIDSVSDGAKNRALKYEQVPQIDSSIAYALALGKPVSVGFSVYGNFNPDPTTGIIPMPDLRYSLLGGHNTLIVGRDGPRRLYLIRNSWGGAWGLGGYAWMPFDYLLSQHYAFDFWTVDTVTPTPGPTPVPVPPTPPTPPVPVPPGPSPMTPDQLFDAARASKLFIVQAGYDAHHVEFKHRDGTMLSPRAVLYIG